MLKLSASYNKFLLGKVAPLHSALRATEAARSVSKVIRIRTSKNWTPVTGLRLRASKCVFSPHDCLF